ncbi:MAG: hypothetical protein QXR45_13460 [Candidatus Bathyarchaeia archaeon]
MSSVEKIVKILLLTVFLLKFLSVFPLTVVYAELPLVGDLTLTGNAVEEIVNVTLTVNGSIIIKNNATLRIINSVLIFGSPSYNITLKEPSNGSPKLMIINSNISCRTTRDYQGFSINLYGNSSISMKNSYIEKAIISIRDVSKVDVSRTIMSAQINLYKTSTLNATSINLVNVKEPHRFTSRIECFDNSKVFISNTTAETAIYVRIWDSSTLTLRNCGTNWAIQLYEKANLYLIRGKVEGRIEINDESYAEIVNPSLIKTLNASGYASARIYNTTILFSATEKTVLSGFSTIYIENVKVRQRLLLLDKSRLYAINSQLRQAEIYDGTVLTVIDTQLENLVARGSSTLFIKGKSQVNCTLREYASAFITNAYLIDSFISASDNTNIIVLQSTLIGKINLDKKATFQIVDSKIQWLGLKDNVVARITKVTISSYLGISGNVKISAIGTTINVMTMDKTSEAMIERSNITVINAFDSPRINIKLSSVGEITIYLKSARCIFEGLGSMPRTNYTVPNNVEGCVPIITLSETKVRSWNIFVIGESNVKFKDCRLNIMGISGNSTVTFYNTTASHVYVNDHSCLHAYWYLDVIAYNGTEVFVKDYKGDVIFQTRVEDKIRIILLEKIVNASTAIINNKYSVLLNRDGQQHQYDIELTSNVVIDLTMTKSPEWTILGLIIITVIVVLSVILWIRFHGVSKVFKRKA